MIIEFLLLHILLLWLAKSYNDHQSVTIDEFSKASRMRDMQPRQGSKEEVCKV